MQQHLEILDASRCVEPPPTTMQHIRMMKRSQSTPTCLTTSLRSATETGAGPNDGLSFVWPLVVSFPFVFLFVNLLTFLLFSTTRTIPLPTTTTTRTTIAPRGNMKGPKWRFYPSYGPLMYVFLFVFLFDDIVLTFFYIDSAFFPQNHECIAMCTNKVYQPSPSTPQPATMMTTNVGSRRICVSSLGMFFIFFCFLFTNYYFRLELHEWTTSTRIFFFQLTNLFFLLDSIFTPSKPRTSRNMYEEGPNDGLPPFGL